MFQKIIYIILICFSINCLGQNENETPKFSFSPIVAFGVALPSKITNLSGKDKLSYNPASRITGSLVNSAGSASLFSLYLTNTIGFETNYHFNFSNSVSLGFTRTSQINSLQNPFEYTFAKAKVLDWYGVLRYYNFTAAPRRTWVNKNGTKYFAQFGVSFSTGFGAQFDNNPNQPIDRGSFVENGTGVEIEAINAVNSTIILGPEIGWRAHEYHPLDFSIALNLPLMPVYHERYYFFKNFQQTGSNEVSVNQASLWLRARYTFELSKNKKIKPPKQPKKKEKEDEPIIAKKEKVDFENKKIETGEKIILKNIQFEQTKSVLNPAGMEELDRLVVLMNNYPKMRIEITGHTSSEGDRYDNIELSRKRAEACKEYLRKRGIEGNRILTRGIGPDSPISSTDKSLNRRVEFSVIRVN